MFEVTLMLPNRVRTSPQTFEKILFHSQKWAGWSVARMWTYFLNGELKLAKAEISRPKECNSKEHLFKKTLHTQTSRVRWYQLFHIVEQKLRIQRPGDDRWWYHVIFFHNFGLIVALIFILLLSHGMYSPRHGPSFSRGSSDVSNQNDVFRSGRSCDGWGSQGHDGSFGEHLGPHT